VRVAADATARAPSRGRALRSGLVSGRVLGPLLTPRQVEAELRRAFGSYPWLDGRTERWTRTPEGQRALPSISLGGHARYLPADVGEYVLRRKRRAGTGDPQARGLGALLQVPWLQGLDFRPAEPPSLAVNRPRIREAAERLTKDLIKSTTYAVVPLDVAPLRRVEDVDRSLVEFLAWWCSAEHERAGLDSCWLERLQAALIVAKRTRHEFLEGELRGRDVISVLRAYSEGVGRVLSDVDYWRRTPYLSVAKTAEVLSVSPRWLRTPTGRTEVQPELSRARPRYRRAALAALVRQRRNHNWVEANGYRPGAGAFGWTGDLPERLRLVDTWLPCAPDVWSVTGDPEELVTRAAELRNRVESIQRDVDLLDRCIDHGRPYARFRVFAGARELDYTGLTVGQLLRWVAHC
jgi:hypothetical protein